MKKNKEICVKPAMISYFYELLFAKKKIEVSKVFTFPKILVLHISLRDNQITQ